MKMTLPYSNMSPENDNDSVVDTHRCLKIYIHSHLKISQRDSASVPMGETRSLLMLIFLWNNFRRSYLRHKGSHWYARLPNKAVDHDDCSWYNDSRIIPRNVMACFTHVLSQSWFWAVKIRNSPLMFFQTCVKLQSAYILSRNHCMV